MQINEMRQAIQFQNKTNDGARNWCKKILDFKRN